MSERVIVTMIVGIIAMTMIAATLTTVAYAQPSTPSEEQERLIEESQPSLPPEEEEAGPEAAEEEGLIEESQPSLPSGEQRRLIEEMVKQGSFLMPVEDIREILEFRGAAEKAPIAISGDNVYVVWWENKTGNWEIFFRASFDNGQTFGDEINLSNDTTRSDDGNIAAIGNNVYVTWWNTNNQTGLREPIFITSNDNGATFGESIRLSGNESTQTPGFGGG